MNTNFTISELNWFIIQVKSCVKANREIMIEGYANYLNECNDGKTLSIEAYSVVVLGVKDPYFEFQANDLTNFLYNFINSYHSFLQSKKKSIPNFDIDFYCDKFIIEAKNVGVKRFLEGLNYEI